MRSEYEVNHAVETYANMIQRICLYYLKNQSDTEDIFQNVFLKYMLHEGVFKEEEHEKAWLIRVTINACKDHLKSLFRYRTIPLEDFTEQPTEIPEEHQEVLEALLSLSAKYKDVLYLHYYEGYSALEISRILGKKENTIYSLLSRGRGSLKDKLGGDEFGE